MIAQNNRIMISVVGFYILLFVIGSFADLPLAQVVIDQKNPWPIIVNSALLLSPVILWCFFSGILIAWLVKASKLSRAVKCLGSALAILLVFCALWYLSGDFLRSMSNGLQNKEAGLAIGFPKTYPSSFDHYQQGLLTLSLFVLFFMCMFVWLRNVSEQRINTLLVISLCGIAVTVMVNDASVVAMLKSFFGRPRPYEVLGEPYASVPSISYLPWYQLTPFSGHTSFPSGHNASAWQLVYLVFFVDPTKTAIRRIILAVTVGFGMLMMASRMIYGYHFLTDVLAGSALAVLVSLVMGAMATKILSNFSNLGNR